MNLRDGYVACMLHDVKKTLLCKEQNGHYGRWRDHWRLDELGYDQSIDDLSNEKVDLENDRQFLLVKLHHVNLDHSSLKEDIEKLIKQNTDALIIASIGIADAIHKSLYFESEELESYFYRIDNNRELGMSFPFYYPFYGSPIIWLPEDRIDPKWYRKLPKKVCEINAREKILKKAQEKLQKAKNAKSSVNSVNFITAKLLVEMQESIFYRFPDTTYLPITSIGFHHRLTTALFLLMHKHLGNLEIEKDRRSKTVALDLCLNTIISPNEKLTNRLRDTTTVRKISHLLQQKLHEYTKGKLLREIKGLEFQGPDQNPFFFYNKDAIVMLNSQNEQDGVLRCCYQVAKMTESVITVDIIQAKAKAKLEFKKAMGSSTELRNIKLENLEKVTRERIESSKTSLDCIWKNPKTSQFEEEQSYCYICNKPTSELKLCDHDMLCPVCRMMRYDFRYCYNHKVFFKSKKCPYDSQKCGYLPTPELLKQSKILRVAYVLVKTNCNYKSIKTDADALMAKYREERYNFEKGDNNYLESIKKKLAMTSTTKYGIFEYLQAVLDMTKFQSNINFAIRKILESDNKYRRKDKKWDITDAALSQYFLYRSPTLTVVVIPEEILPKFFCEIEPLLNELNISHCIRIMTCNNNHPVWMVLRSLKINEPEQLISDKVEEKAEKVNELVEEVRESVRKNQDCKKLADEVFKKSKEFLEAYYYKKDPESEKDPEFVPELRSRELTLIIHRSGIEREFHGAQAYFLLKNCPGVNKNLSSQLGYLSEFSSRLLAEMGEEGISQQEATFRANMLLELDSKTKDKSKEKIPEDVAKVLRQHIKTKTMKPSDLPGFIREIANYGQFTYSKK